MLTSKDAKDKKFFEDIEIEEGKAIECFGNSKYRVDGENDFKNLFTMKSLILAQDER